MSHYNNNQKLIFQIPWKPEFTNGEKVCSICLKKKRECSNMNHNVCYLCSHFHGKLIHALNKIDYHIEKKYNPYTEQEKPEEVETLIAYIETIRHTSTNIINKHKRIRLETTTEVDLKEKEDAKEKPNDTEALTEEETDENNNNTNQRVIEVDEEGEFPIFQSNQWIT